MDFIDWKDTSNNAKYKHISQNKENTYVLYWLYYKHTYIHSG